MGAVLPPTWVLLTFWPSAFIAGFFIGRYSERHKETIDMKLDTFRVRFNAWYDRWARVLITVIGALAVIGALFGGVATFVNIRQDAERDQLLACFDEYATASAGSSAAVREASVAKDEASADRDAASARRDMALGTALTGLVANSPNLLQSAADLATANGALVAAQRRVVSAQKALDKAREENPVPEPPSEFCAVKP